jgi:molybdopterin-guanine dinucleotide biosynthesis protein A
MASIANATGIILAGGEGRRAGHRDKGLIPWHGKPLIAHVIDRLGPQVSELLISCNRNFVEYETFGARTVADLRHDFQGPLAGLESAAAHVKTDLVVVVCCDTPQLPVDLAHRLLAPLLFRGINSSGVTYAHDGARAQYLCAAMTRESLSTLPQFLDDGHRAVHEWYRRQNAMAVDFSDRTDCFRNYNWLV